MIRKLIAGIEKTGAPIVVGLDPMLSFIPEHIRNRAYEEHGETLKGAGEAIWEYNRGIVDAVIMRICDVLFAFPGIILAIAIVAILGSGIGNVVIAVSVFSTPTFARLVRSRTLALKNSVFVQAAKNLGASDARILFRHILPGAVPEIIVQFTMSVGSSILTASSLSFLGMGAQPPTPEWGLLLANGRNYMMTSMHCTVFPGLAIFLTVLSFNILGDGLRDALDPKLTD